MKKYAYEEMPLGAFVERLYDFSIGRAEPRRIAHVAAEHLVAQRAEIERLRCIIESRDSELNRAHSMNGEWQMPKYGYDQWKFASEVGWYNPEDDPATATEEALLNEITRLRSLVAEWVDADDGVTAAADARPFAREPYDVAIERCDMAYAALRAEAARISEEAS